MPDFLTDKAMRTRPKQAGQVVGFRNAEMKKKWVPQNNNGPKLFVGYKEGEEIQLCYAR